VVLREVRPVDLRAVGLFTRMENHNERTYKRPTAVP
jgi:hypothetical protein